MSTFSKRVFLIGAQPPPIHGMAAINGAVRERLVAQGVAPIIIDVAAPTLKRSFEGRLGRIPKVILGLRKFAFAKRAIGGVLYMSVSGGLGQTYEVLFLALARLKGLRCYLHHHSYAYLNSPNALAQLLIRMSGSSATHIALSQGMASTLSRTYPRVRRTVVASNSGLLSVPVCDPWAPKALVSTIGFLGNISREKGIFDYLDLLDALHKKGTHIRGVIAGPIQDERTAKALEVRLEKLPGAKYIGPKYGEAKSKFFRDIDVLVFPTRYPNEAEPLTVHESLMHGVPVITFNRGCIGEMVDSSCGLVIDTKEDFVRVAERQITLWRATTSAFHDVSKGARTKFLVVQNEAHSAWTRLLCELSE